MSGYNNNYSDDDFDFEADQRGGGGLRKMLEETLAENKKLLARLEGQDREKSTAALLKEKGLDPAIAEIIPEGFDPKEWIDKYSHLLGVPNDHEDTSNPAPVEVQLADDSDPAIVAAREEAARERQALADMQAAAESGSPAVLSDLTQQMDKIDSEEELLKFFADHGARETD